MSIDLCDLRSELARDPRLAKALGGVWDRHDWLDRIMEIVSECQEAAPVVPDGPEHSIACAVRWNEGRCNCHLADPMQESR